MSNLPELNVPMPTELAIKVVLSDDEKAIVNQADIYHALLPHLSTPALKYLPSTNHFISDDMAFTLAADMIQLDKAKQDGNLTSDRVYNIAAFCLNISLSGRRNFPNKYGPTKDSDDIRKGLVKDVLRYRMQPQAVELALKEDYQLRGFRGMLAFAEEIGNREGLPKEWVDSEMNMLMLFIALAFYEDRIKGLVDRFVGDNVEGE